MKKMKLWMMLFCIGLLFVSGGVAEEMALDLTQMARFETASSLCWIDDSLYVLGNKGVYSWKSGSENMNTVIDLAAASNYDYVQDCPEDESEATVWNQMLQLIFTDGEALYGLHPYSGMIKKIEGNAQTDVAEIQQEYLYSEDMEAYREIRQAVYADKKLYLLLGTDTYEEYDKTELYISLCLMQRKMCRLLVRQLGCMRLQMEGISSSVILREMKLPARRFLPSQDI